MRAAKTRSSNSGARSSMSTNYSSRASRKDDDDDDDDDGHIGHDDSSRMGGTPANATTHNHGRGSSSNDDQRRASVSPQQFNHQQHRRRRSSSQPNGVDDNNGPNDLGQDPSSSRRISNGEGDDDDDDYDVEADDALLYCRCDTPKSFVELLRTFGVAKGSNSSGGGTTAMTTTQQQQRQLKGTDGGRGRQSISATATTPPATATTQHPMTVFCTKRGLTIHSQSTNAAFQASMELPMALFSEFRLAGTSAGKNYLGDEDDDDENDSDLSHEFTVHWKTLMECLTVMMTSGMMVTTTSSSSSGGTNSSFMNRSSASASFFHPSTYRLPKQSLVLSYHTSTELLKIELLSQSFDETADHDHGGQGSLSTAIPLATCALPGLDSTDSLTDTDGVEDAATAYRSSPVAARCLTRSSNLVPYVNELDLIPGATIVQISFVHQRHTVRKDGKYKPSSVVGQRYIRLKTKGDTSQVVVDIPGPIELEDQTSNDGNHNGTQQMMKSDGNQRSIHRVTHSYSLASWRQALQPLDLARETCISVNRHGILAVQHQLVLRDVVNGERNSSSSNSTINGGRRRSTPIHENDTSNNNNRGSTGLNDDAAAFCDFLILPLADLDDGDNFDSDSDADEDDYDGHEDDDTMNGAQSVATTTTRKTQAMERGNHRTNSRDRHRASRYRVTALAAAAPSSATVSNGLPNCQTQDGDRSQCSPNDSAFGGNNRTQMSVGNYRDSEGDESETDVDGDKDHPLPSSHRRPLLFGRRSGGSNRNNNTNTSLDDSRTAGSTMSASQMTEDAPSTVQDNQLSVVSAAAGARAMERDRRKRQRRQQHHHHHHSHSPSENHDHSNADTSGVSWKDVDAGNASPASEQGGRHHRNNDCWRPNRGYGDPDEPVTNDEEERYCSSPELVYGDEE